MIGQLLVLHMFCLRNTVLFFIKYWIHPIYSLDYLEYIMELYHG